MTQVNTPDGPIETTLPPEAVADLQQPVEAPKEPEKAPEIAPEPPVKPAEPKAEETPEPPKDPERDPETGKFSRKPKPIANLLAKNHDLETQLEAKGKAIADLETKLTELTAKPASAEATDKIKALAEKYGLEPEVLSDIVAIARDGMNPSPQLPAELTDMLHEHQVAKQEAQESAAFNKRVDSLSVTLKDEALKDPKVREKLQQLAYSADKAPDGEPYFQKELAELYIGFIKPEIEPGKPSAEPSRGGAGTGATIVDFQDVFDRDDPKEIEDMSPERFRAFSKWLNEKQGDIPLTRRK